MRTQECHEMLFRRECAECFARRNAAAAADAAGGSIPSAYGGTQCLLLLVAVVVCIATGVVCCCHPSKLCKKQHHHQHPNGLNVPRFVLFVRHTEYSCSVQPPCYHQSVDFCWLSMLVTIKHNCRNCCELLASHSK